MNNNPIGMFDSGVGGFTLVKEAFKLLPNEEIIYFGDTARSPYGAKTDEEIFQCSRDIVDYLIHEGVKLIVIACNTATIASIERLNKKYDIPIIGVVDPCIDAALYDVKTSRIGLIGTDFTVNSKKYEEMIRSKREDIQIIAKGCPKLVTLAEQGEINNEISKLAVGECLKDLLENDIDTLILACTHFPLHLKDIKKVVSENIHIVDPALKTIETTLNVLRENNMLREDLRKPKHKFICSGELEGFTKVYNVIFQEKNEIIERKWNK